MKFVERKQRRELRGQNVNMAGSELRNDSDSEEDVLWYYYLDRVDMPLMSEYVTQEESAVDEETVYRPDELDRKAAELDKASFTYQVHEALLDQTLEELEDPALEGEIRKYIL